VFNELQNKQVVFELPPNTIHLIFPYFNGDNFLSFWPSAGHLTETIVATQPLNVMHL